MQTGVTKELRVLTVRLHLHQLWLDARWIKFMTRGDVIQELVLLL
jgi:hypothetical protein